MEFCSKYGYDYGFSGSESEEISDEEGEQEKKTTRRFRKADANIIAVKFDLLVESNEMHPGDPVACKHCDAFMSILSKNIVNNQWTCEFCEHVNEVPLFDQNQLPKVDDVTYLLEAAPVLTKPETSTEGGDDPMDGSHIKSTDDNYLTFCIDISGSMNTNCGGGMNRLDAIKLACSENIETLRTEEPNKRVGLVTFSQEVKFYGDCKKGKPLMSTKDRENDGPMGYQLFPIQRPQMKKKSRTNLAQTANNNSSAMGSVKKLINIFSLNRPQTRSQTASVNKQVQQTPIQFQTSFSRSQSSSSSIGTDEEDGTDDILMNKEKIMTLGVNQNNEFRSVSESHLNLKAHIKKLRTEGATALGPGLAFSIGFSGKKSGSQIILCTDGCANVGMGTLGYGNDQNESNTFYDELAEDAKQRNVTVNVISLQGTDCKLSMLGKVADKTNGTLNIVNPLNLGEEFKSILKNRIVATNVTAKLIVNKKYLYIRDEELEIAESKAIESNDKAKKEALNEARKNFSVKDIGNANIDTEVTFEYGIRKLKNADKEKKIKSMPFQLQITYTTEDGAKAVRVYTKEQEFTSDRKVAEDNLVEQDIIWSNAAQKMSSHFLSDNAVVAKYKSRQMKNLQQRSARFAAPAQFQQQQGVIEQSSKMRKCAQLNDTEAQQLYSAKKSNRKGWKK